MIEAMLRDEQLAEVLAKEDQPESLKPTRRMADWSVDVELLTTIGDRIAELGQIFAAHRGVKPHRVEPLPRPTTAVQKYRDRTRQQRHLALVAQVLPHKAAALDRPAPDLPGPPR